MTQPLEQARALRTAAEQLRHLIAGGAPFANSNG